MSSYQLLNLTDRFEDMTTLLIRGKCFKTMQLLHFMGRTCIKLWQTIEGTAYPTFLVLFEEVRHNLYLQRLCKMASMTGIVGQLE